MRRQTVGIDPLGAKTETASTETPIASKNKGFQMLAKMGWSKGQGLGKSETAIVEPVRIRLYNFCFYPFLPLQIHLSIRFFIICGGEFNFFKHVHSVDILGKR